jgi:hypothetical protein
MNLDEVSPATRLLEKRRQMFEVQEALETQKEEFARREELFKRREEALRKQDLELQQQLIRFNKFLQVWQTHFTETQNFIWRLEDRKTTQKQLAQKRRPQKKLGFVNKKKKKFKIYRYRWHHSLVIMLSFVAWFILFLKVEKLTSEKEKMKRGLDKSMVYEKYLHLGGNGQTWKDDTRHVVYCTWLKALVERR